MDLGLKNKRIVITGSSRGLGEEIAKQLIEEWALMTLVARNEEKLKTIINNVAINLFINTYIQFFKTKILKLNVVIFH